MAIYKHDGAILHPDRQLSLGLLGGVSPLMDDLALLHLKSLLGLDFLILHFQHMLNSLLPVDAFSLNIAFRCLKFGPQSGYRLRVLGPPLVISSIRLTNTAPITIPMHSDGRCIWITSVSA